MGCRHQDGFMPIGIGSALPWSRCVEGWERDGSRHPAPMARPLPPPRAGSGENQTLPTPCSPPGDVEELLPPPRRAAPREIPAGRRDPGDSPGCARSRGAHRGLPVRVGEDPVDLHVAPVGRCHVHPQPPQARIPRAVGAGHVVAVVVLLQQGGGQGTASARLLPGGTQNPRAQLGALSPVQRSGDSSAAIPRGKPAPGGAERLQKERRGATSPAHGREQGLAGRRGAVAHGRLQQSRCGCPEKKIPGWKLELKRPPGAKHTDEDVKARRKQPTSVHAAEGRRAPSPSPARGTPGLLLSAPQLRGGRSPLGTQPGAATCQGGGVVSSFSLGKLCSVPDAGTMPCSPLVPACCPRAAQPLPTPALAPSTPPARSQLHKPRRCRQGRRRQPKN